MRSRCPAGSVRLVTATMSFAAKLRGNECWNGVPPATVARGFCEELQTGVLVGVVWACPDLSPRSAPNDNNNAVATAKLTRFFVQFLNLYMIVSPLLMEIDS